MLTPDPGAPADHGDDSPPLAPIVSERHELDARIVLNLSHDRLLR